jgi:hypothetical protein
VSDPDEWVRLNKAYRLTDEELAQWAAAGVVVPGYPSDEGVPKRVLEAEARRATALKMASSSLGCMCGHLPAEHADRGAHRDRGKCGVLECDCERWRFYLTRKSDDA